MRETQEQQWEERTTASLLKAARRSGYFANVIIDAKHFESQGYAWVVALKLACNYWCN